MILAIKFIVRFRKLFYGLDIVNAKQHLNENMQCYLLKPNSFDYNNNNNYHISTFLMKTNEYIYHANTKIIL